MTIWISNRQGEGGSGGGQTAGGAVGAGLAGGAVEAIRLAFGGGSSHQMDENDPRRDPQTAVCERAAEQRQRETRSRIALEEQRNRICFSKIKKATDTSIIPVFFSVNGTANESLCMRVARQAEEHMALLRPKFPRAPTLHSSDFGWCSDVGEYLFEPADAGLKVDLSNDSEYKFVSNTAQEAPEHERQVLHDFYRRVSGIYIMQPEIALYSVVAERAEPGRPAGLSRYNIQYPRSSYDLGVHNMMNRIYHSLDHRVPTLSESDDVYDLIHKLKPELRKAQMDQLELVLGDFTSRIEALEEQYGVTPKNIPTPPATIYTSGNRTFLDGNGNPINLLFGGTSQLLGFSAPFIAGLDFGEPSAGFSRPVIDAQFEASGPLSSNLASDPSRLVADIPDKGSRRSIFQWARDWLEDDTWLRAGEAISEVASGDRVTEETKQSWSTWDEVGQHIVSRIMAPIADDDTNVLRKTAQYYAVCWAKAKEEAPPRECIDVFRQHCWEATSSAAQTLIIGLATRTASKDTKVAIQLRAVWDSLGSTLRDPRCVQSRLDRKVDECVKEMYDASDAFEAEL